MNIGIRLHDVAGATLEEKLQNAKAQGFSCVHLALSKVLPDFPMEKAPELLTPALAEELKALFAKYGLRIVVLGCYLNLATPDMEELQRTMEIYKAHLRFAPLLGAEVVARRRATPTRPMPWTKTATPRQACACSWTVWRPWCAMRRNAARCWPLSLYAGTSSTRPSGRPGYWRPSPPRICG